MMLLGLSVMDLLAIIIDFVPIFACLLFTVWKIWKFTIVRELGNNKVTTVPEIN